MRMLKFYLRKRIVQTTLRFLTEFLENVPIHGASNMAHTDIHWTEFFFWLFTVVSMTTTAFYLSFNLLGHYYDSSAIITVSPNYMELVTSTPSFTFCPYDILDDEKIAKYLRSSNQRIYYIKTTGIPFLLKKLAHMNIATLQHFHFSFQVVESTDLMPLIFNLSKDYDITVNGISGVKVMTDLGICYTFNNILANEVSTVHWGDIHSQKPLTQPATTGTDGPPLGIPENFNFYSVYPLQLYFFHNITTGLSVYVHARNELPTTWTRSAADVSASGLASVSWNSFETTYQEDFIRASDIQQRDCRTQRESNLEMFPRVYSRNLCLMECRAMYALDLCHCLPHFYSRSTIAQRHRPICTIAGLNCLSQYSEIFRNMHDSEPNSPFNCSCLPNCSLLSVITDVANTELLEGHNVGAPSILIKMSIPPIVQYRRSIIYSSQDYTVAVGSVLSVFIGCSLLSFVDMVYYFTLRWFWFVRGYREARDAH